MTKTTAKKDPFTTEERKDLLAAARVARQDPETEGLWDQVADYFRTRREGAKTLVTPRPEV